MQVISSTRKEKIGSPVIKKSVNGKVAGIINKDSINKRFADSTTHDAASNKVNDSMSMLKNNQLAALESLVLLLLREVDLMKKLEARVEEGINGNGICLYDEMQRFEASMIRSALIQAGGVQSTAAKLLGMKVTTLNLKIKRYKIGFTDLEIAED